MSTPATDRTYSTSEVCALLNISSRQMLCLVDRGVAEPSTAERSGSGYPLRWTATEVAHLSRPVELARLLRSPLTGPIIALAFGCNNDDYEMLIALLRRNQPAPQSGAEQAQ